VTSVRLVTGQIRRGGIEGAPMLGIGTSSRWALVGAIGVVLGGAALTPAQANEPNSAAADTRPSFVSFLSFVSDVSKLDYRAAAKRGLTGAVRSEQSFLQMRSYVLDRYRNVKVTHSYIADGNYFDCVTLGSQPTVRDRRIAKIATPPPASKAIVKAPGTARAVASPLTLGKKDAFGNAISCAAGTIPMQRVSMERLAKFPTLQAFLTKTPTNRLAAPAHRYAAARQYVNNWGGNSWLNLWNPSGEFTLSQQWYATTSGTTQTVEGGWVRYAPKFGNNSVLFIFWTPDNYAHGCYNLDCSGFVQTNNRWALGGAFDRYSVYGGAQYGFRMQWQLYQGNWWLLLQGPGAIETVGYYPGSIYNGGGMSRNATEVTYGGETFTNGTSQPQMGSGAFAAEGWTKAAYQNTIYYHSDSNMTSAWADLNSHIVTHPACYTMTYTPASSGGNWGTYIFFGGPGGNC
jgi:hypothetical protein